MRTSLKNFFVWVRLAQAGAGCEADRFHKFSPGHFAAIGRPHAGNAKAAIGADDGKAVIVRFNNFAELAGDAFRSFGGQGRCVKNLELLVGQIRPGARRRTAAADQRIDLAP
ncbi:MAG: hypothetical protein V3S07_02445 [Micropepsaceae bacterium]